MHEVKELKEIREYWAKKYPGIDISLYRNQDGTKYYGKMHAYESSFDINADTIGELISQGESFLRRMK